MIHPSITSYKKKTLKRLKLYLQNSNMNHKQRLWSPTERSCLFLLQTKNSKHSLLQIHAFMLRRALETNVNLLTKFIATCSSLPGGIRHARQLFDRRTERDDTFLCNSMIISHLGSSEYTESVSLYKELKRDTCFIADNFTFSSLAKSCALAKAVREGEQIHVHAVKFGLCLDLYVSTSLVDMYAKFGKMWEAQRVFEEISQPSEVSWTALVGGYARRGDMGNARKCFDSMPYKDTAACNAMVDAYVKSGEMELARGLFEQIVEKNVMSWTSMIKGYCNYGDVFSARMLFDAMPEKNQFSWNAMIGGYCQNKNPREALNLFHEMQSHTSLEPDMVTVVSILPAIADLGALALGGWVHQFVRMKKLDKETNVCTALVDMYAKCGAVMTAKKVFNEIAIKETACWNAMISGFAVNGYGKEAMEVFAEMRHQGFKPNEVTMLGVLSACNHNGLVEEGKRWFNAMEGLGLTLQIEHYGCMVDLLGKAGHLDEAENLIQTMPYKANGIILSSFMNACGSSKDVKRVERVIKRALEMEPSNDGNYVILRNLYATEKRWNEAEEIKGLMKRNGVKKETGCSIIEVDTDVYEFVAGDRMHPKKDVISSVLRQLLNNMKVEIIC